MSSHHIVKEKQEPALYIHHLGTFDEEYLGQLLEWSPTLIVSTSEYEKVLSLGLKVDLVVSAGEPVFFQENTKVIPTAGEALDAVLDYLIAEKYPAVNVIDSVSNLRELGNYITDINIVVFKETEKSYAIKSGFKVWKPKDSVFHIEVISYFETSNLKPAENGDFIVIDDGFVDFTFITPYLFISEVL
ncbi:thiamine pyrophosphokinase [Pedobacter metabolipauper]|uniref:Thiamine pyrophosphokinase n=1 Tax=Pedobacter metabolipauper TaxID=425513 RepID=A0A4R6SWD7_9SPHI|nr:thiamine pyrophosphokinase [Pedobacter metabolipauper]TDQ09423.1 thiamine pyrophosphokinase [Pedobacter metabolipauper]